MWPAPMPCHAPYFVLFHTRSIEHPVRMPPEPTGTNQCLCFAKALPGAKNATWNPPYGAGGAGSNEAPGRLNRLNRGDFTEIHKDRQRVSSRR